jgi:hypothetical protein
MDKIFYFSSGYLFGVLTTEHKYTLMYTSYKYYAIASDYYDRFTSKYIKSNKTCFVKRISMNMDKNTNIPLPLQNGCFIVNELLVNGIPTFTASCNNTSLNCLDKEEPILSATLYHVINNDIFTKDITYELNSLIMNDGYFVYKDNAKKAYNKLIGYSKYDNEKTKYYIEYMDRNDLIIKQLENGILKYENEKIIEF